MSLVRTFAAAFFALTAAACALPFDDEAADTLTCVTGSVPVRVENASNRAMDVTIEAHDRVIVDRRLGRGARDRVTFARRRGTDSYVTVRARPSNGGEALAPIVVSADRLDVRIKCSNDDCWLAIADSGMCR